MSFLVYSLAYSKGFINLMIRNEGVCNWCTFRFFKILWDSWSHDFVLKKLSHYGIIGNSLKWFTCYLTNLRQCATCCRDTSAMKGASCGVPRGSILGPFLFLLYINDLCSAGKQTTPISFADYTYWFCGVSDAESVESNINNELSQISLWLKVDKLSVKIKKTHHMMSIKRRTPNCIKTKHWWRSYQ